ncbi:MAG: SDR family oxidoreductase [Cyclobacteriaceae bacterium]
MKIDLNGFRAVIGGSSRGLGFAIAGQLASCGAQVTLMARNREKLEDALRSLPQPTGAAHDYLLVDYSDFEQFQDLTADFFKDNPIDILVNNTNGPKAGTVFEKTVGDYQEAFDLLFKTYHHLTHLLLPKMKINGYGRIINVSSISVKEPMANLVLSNSIRSAVISWAKSLSREVAADGITVNNILTGSFETERIEELVQAQSVKTGISFDDLLEEKKSAIPQKRFGQPKEYGYLAAFLASPYAAYINGTNIPIDGGFLNSL